MDGTHQQNGFAGFIGTKPAKILGLVLAFAIGMLMMYFELFSIMCMYMVIGIILFAIPKLLGVSSFKLMVILGVSFFLASSLFGALGVSQPYVNSMSNPADFDSNGFTDVTIVAEDDGKYTFTTSYTSTDPSTIVKLKAGKISSICYTAIPANIDYKVYSMDYNSVTKTYSCTIGDISPKNLYSYGFETVDGSNTVTASTYNRMYAPMSDSELMTFTITWNMYTCVLVTLVFFLILMLTTWMRKNLEKTRAKMEAEGRLYPQGYGRCKDCGGIVLPGELTCRKCGAYIDVPTEIKIKKVDTFECSECGAEVPNDATTCPRCGAVFDEEDEIEVIDDTKQKKE